MTHHGWVLCPIEDDCIGLEDMGFEITKSKTILTGLFELYGYEVLGNIEAYEELKRFKGRYYWSIKDIGGEDDVGRNTEESFRESQSRRGSLQPSLF
jgi:hypothetical protein